MGDCNSTFGDDEDKHRTEEPSPGRPPGAGRGSFPSTTQPGGNPIGSKVYIYKQDPLVIGHRIAWLPFDIHTGPETDDVVVMGMSKSYRETDNQGNFLYDPRLDPDGFDAVNTLAIVQHVIWMYRRILSLAKQKSINWLWGSRPIQVFPHAGKDSNAYYSRGEKALKFFYFPDGVKVIYSCRSWDIVAHETGHAVLDAVKPGWITSSHLHTGALHEAFGDITSIFSVLDQLDMCELVVAHTKGELANRHHFLAALGEEFGRGIGRYYGLRNADEDLRISQSTAESHELSKVFTGAVYDILVRIFAATLHLAEYPPAETLYRAGRHLLSVFVLAILEAPYKDATFEDVANLMIKKEPQMVFKGYMKDEFTRREVFNEWARPLPNRKSLLADRTVHACATLRACGMKIQGMAEPRGTAERPSSLAGSNKGSLTHKNVQQNNHIQLDPPPSVGQRSTSMGRRNVQENTNYDTSHYKNSTALRNAHHSANYQDNTSSFKGSLGLGQRNVQQGNHQDSHTTGKGSLGHRNVQQSANYQDSHITGKGSLGHRNVQQSANYQDSPITGKGSLGHRNVQQSVNYQDSPSTGKRSLGHRNVQQNVNYQDSPSTSKGSLGHRNVQQSANYQDSPSTDKGSLGHRNVQQSVNYQNSPSTGKGSLGHRNEQQRHNYQEISSFKGNQTPRSTTERDSYQDNTSSFKGNIGHRNAQQGHTYQDNTSSSYKVTRKLQQTTAYADNTTPFQDSVGRSHTQHNPTYQALTHRLPPPPPPDNNANLEFPPPPPIADMVWEHQSSTYSDTVFDSTEI